MIKSIDLLNKWIEESPEKAQLVSKLKWETTESELLGITEKSILGSLLNTYGGISCCNDHIYHLGSKNGKRSSICEFNEVRDYMPTLLPGFLITAFDSNGGVFGINCGIAEELRMGDMLYLPAESYRFEAMKIGHADFVQWSLELSEEEWRAGGWCTKESRKSVMDIDDTELKGRVSIYIALAVQSNSL